MSDEELVERFAAIALVAALELAVCTSDLIRLASAEGSGDAEIALVLYAAFRAHAAQLERGVVDAGSHAFVERLVSVVTARLPEMALRAAIAPLDDPGCVREGDRAPAGRPGGSDAGGDPPL